MKWQLKTRKIFPPFSYHLRIPMIGAYDMTELQFQLQKNKPWTRFSWTAKLCNFKTYALVAVETKPSEACNIAVIFLPDNTFHYQSICLCCSQTAITDFGNNIKAINNRRSSSSNKVSSDVAFGNRTITSSTHRRNQYASTSNQYCKYKEQIVVKH